MGFWTKVRPLSCRGGRWMLASAMVATGVMTSGARDAEAYCRSTTCTGDCPRDDDGCKTSGEPLYWETSCVGVSLQEDSSKYIPFKYFEETAERSLVAWTQLECDTGTASIAFSPQPVVACRENEYNSDGTNANIVLFQDTRWDYQGVDNTLAKTTVTFDKETGEILDADIEINQANNHFTISDTNIDYDLESILTHEFGHLLGLDHSVDFSATMYAGYEPGTTEQRSLEEDDRLAICDVYPPERDATCDPTPKGGLGTECGGVDIGESDDDGAVGCSVGGPGSLGSGSLGTVAALGAVGLVLMRRPRRKRGVS